MLGAIIGDVAGSYYEVLEAKEKKINKRPRKYEDRIKILDYDVPLFTDNSTCTDDSVLTCAIYDAIKNGDCDYEKYLRIYGKREVELGKDNFGRNRFGKKFVEWLDGNYQGDSFGNGAAMRVSPVGYLYDSLKEVKENSYKVTIPSHNNPDAIKSAEAVAVSIFLLRNGYNKELLEKYIKKNYYDLNFDLEDLQREYIFTSKASESVPQALFVFLQSNDFEDAIRKAISIGGDTDTIACIVGSLAEACYGVPEEMREKVRPYLYDYMYDLLKDRYYSKRKMTYERNNKTINN